MKKIYVCRVCGKVNEFDTDDSHPTTRMGDPGERSHGQDNPAEYYILYCQSCHAWNLSLLDTGKPIHTSTN
jgi:hypothetical protein